MRDSTVVTKDSLLSPCTLMLLGVCLMQGCSIELPYSGITINFLHQGLHICPYLSSWNKELTFESLMDVDQSLFFKNSKPL